MGKDTSDANSGASARLCLSDDLDEIEMYVYAATFKGIADYAKAISHKDRPLSSPANLFRDMLNWLEKKTPEIIGKPDNQQRERDNIVEGFKESLISGINVMERLGANDLSQSSMLRLFEIGCYCGVITAMLGEDHSWLQDLLHGQKCSKGKAQAVKNKKAADPKEQTIQEMLELGEKLILEKNPDDPRNQLELALYLWQLDGAHGKSLQAFGVRLKSFADKLKAKARELGFPVYGDPGVTLDDTGVLEYLRK